MFYSTGNTVQYLIMTLNELQPVKILNHYVIHLKYNENQLYLNLKSKLK